MAYSPVTDFLALLRQTSGGLRYERMPGLDYVVAAMARANMFTLYVGQTAPTTNQQSTAWLKPSVPSWVTEGTVFLWNVATQEYETATPTLWTALLTASLLGYSFQAITTASGIVLQYTSLLAIERTAPAATALQLPSVASRQGKALQVADCSSGVTAHTITVTPSGTETIMKQATWTLNSTAAQLAGITFYPSPDLNGWVIA